MNDKVYILVGYQTYEYKDYVWLQNKFNELTNNEKYYYLQENKIPYYFEENKERIEEIKEKYYYVIEFEIDYSKYLDWENELNLLKSKIED